jgi:CubicO group peptidase (beta-lactamase class C family)
MVRSIGSLRDEVAALAETDGCALVAAVSGAGTELEFAGGLASRAHGIPATVATQFAVASVTKGFTALVVMSLISSGVLSLMTPARAVLGADLPLIDEAVTVEHLLEHTSGIGDYVDEESDLDIDVYALPVAVQQLTSTPAYLPVLDGHPTKFAPGTRFGYCNSGYVVLALIAERVAGVPFADLVQERVCAPAGMIDTAFLRSDALPGQAAIGYLADGVRTNVFHLPVCGSGDGGLYSTLSDLRSFWAALFEGRIVPTDVVTSMVTPRHHVAGEGARYGRGFWVHRTGAAVWLEGYDAGVSARTSCDPKTGLTATVLSNTSAGSWPVARRLEELF